jgi:hypothetical protein
MSAALQLIGGIAIILGLAGTWLAGQRRTGWLVCILSSVLWLPALVSGEQWAAVLNVGLSVAICVRNFVAGGRDRVSRPDQKARVSRTNRPRVVLPRQAARDTVGSWT